VVRRRQAPITAAGRGDRVCETARMICMTILYPNTDDSTFDMDYYTSTHMPLVAKAFGDGCHGWGAAAVTTDKHAAIGWVMVDSMDTFNAAMAANGAEIMADVANYTNQTPEVIIGEVTGGS
jgi:uncharacterized protein (TIGR02118 family)